MELTRRDAVRALVVGGGLGASGIAVAEMRDATTDHAANDTEFESDHIKTAVAVGEVVYPTAVSGINEFVEEYLRALPTGKKGKIASVLDSFHAHIQSRHTVQFWNMPIRGRKAALRDLGVTRVSPAATGTLPELVRYHIINQLLYGLFTVPKGSELVGISNPVGYPGGYQSYQQSPNDSS